MKSLCFMATAHPFIAGLMGFLPNAMFDKGLATSSGESQSWPSRPESVRVPWWPPSELLRPKCQPT